MTADERRDYILSLLLNSEEPLSGRQIADKVGVSRQVIVGDMALLKAKMNRYLQRVKDISI